MKRPPVVVKVGGGLLADPSALVSVLTVVDRAAATTPIVVVAGGGVFADAVRDVDRRFTLGDDEAHWMAILGMNQYAHMLAARLARASLVETREQLDAALESGGVPVVAPYAWLRTADPLPHSWSVTSDSIAAWIAGDIGAAQLVLVKPPQAQPPLVDDYLTRALRPGLRLTVTPADERLHSILAAC